MAKQLELEEQRLAQLLEDYPEFINEHGEVNEAFKDWAREKAEKAGEWGRTRGKDIAKQAKRSVSRGVHTVAGAAARGATKVIPKTLGRVGVGDRVKDFGEREATRSSARAAGRKQAGKEKAVANCQTDCADQGLSQGAEQACLTQCDTMTESFFPKDHDIREQKRYKLNENLMKQWGYTNKEK